MTSEEKAWMAGLFEGEGCFLMRRNHTLRMALSMTDRDVVERFARLAGSGSVRCANRLRHNRQEQWRWGISGEAAIALALELRPWLGTRRGSRVDEILAAREAHVAEATRLRVCPTCGKEFQPPWNKVSVRKVFCSHACAWPQEKHGRSVFAGDGRVIDLFSTCFGCGKEFKPGDQRLRFGLDEWGQHEGLAAIPGMDDVLEIGLCEACTQPGDFKHPETVA